MQQGLLLQGTWLRDGSVVRPGPHIHKPQKGIKSEMDGWRDRGVDGWMDLEGPVDGRKEGWVEGWLCDNADAVLQGVPCRYRGEDVGVHRAILSTFLDA